MNADTLTLRLTNYTNKLRLPVTYLANRAFYKLFRLSIDNVLFFVAMLVGFSQLSRAQTPVTNTLTLENLVDKAKANQGDVLTHTLVLTNTGTSSATNILVQDSLSTGLRYIPNSAVAPGGTTFTADVPGSAWTIPTLPAGQRLSLTYQTVADSSGILYSQATIPGDTASSCTSVPVRVCEGDTYVFELTGPAARSSYRWFRNGVELTDQTTRFLSVTSPGSYSLSVDDVSGKCPDFSGCPFIVEQYALPDFQAGTVSASCSDTPQANGKIILSGFNATDTYQYSEGSDFNPSASLSGAPKVIPASGLLADNLTNPTTSRAYTIRVYNASGCYIERTVTLLPAVCCTLTATALPGSCAGETNTFSSTVVVSLANATTGTLTITDGPASQTVAVTTGSTTFTAVFTNLPANGATHAVTASLPGCSTAPTTYAAPASCLAGLTASVLPGDCQPLTNTYSISGSLSLTNAIAGTATISDGVANETVPINAGATSVAYSLTGLPSGSSLHTVVVSYAGQTASATYTAPESCTIQSSAPAMLSLEQRVDKSKTKLGEIISYTVVLTNTGTTTASQIPVQLSTTPGLYYLAASITLPTGTTFAPGVSGGIWTIASISAGQRLSLTFQARADSSGILYDTAILPGDTARVCTTVPVKVCPGAVYAYQLTAAPGHNRYQWFRTINGVISELTSFTTNVLVVTQPGEYKLVTDTSTGDCPTFSCCPFIVEEDSLPTFQATATPVSCVGGNPQANGKIGLSGVKPAYTYQFSMGSSFTPAAVLSGPAKAIPADGLIVSDLPNPTAAQSYTVRVYNESGCYTDATVLLLPTSCNCPDSRCVPFAFRQTKRAVRIGDAR